jgi:hypothetical protein
MEFVNKSKPVLPSNFSDNGASEVLCLGKRLQLMEKRFRVESVETLHFSKDYIFTSPSMASSVVLGRASNGRVDWKDADGKTLIAIQEAQAAR